MHSFSLLTAILLGTLRLRFWKKIRAPEPILGSQGMRALKTKKGVLSKFRAIQKWNPAKQHADFKVLECENGVERVLCAGTACNISLK